MIRLGVALLALVPHLVYGQECRPVRTALVLSGGGVKGLAHIGVIQALDSLGVQPDLVVGTSMGAIVGALYAAGYSGREIDSLVRALPISEIVRPFRVPAPHPWDGRLPLLFLVRGRRGFEFQTGVVDETKPNARLNAAMLRGNLLARGRFDRLPIPFLAVATDLRDRSTVVLGRGDLARAVRASSAVPLVFPPVVIDQAILVDGGLSANVPVAEARAAGAERVIAVDVTEHPSDSLDAESPLALADQLLGFLFQQPLVLRPDDVLVRPTVEGLRSLDFSGPTVTEVLRQGRLAADTTVARMRCLTPKRPPPPPFSGRLAGWSVSGDGADSVLVARMLRLERGAPLDPARFRERLIGLGDSEALRGAWLNPAGTDDSVTLSISPLPAPEAVGGGGLAYDHELGGQIWAGLFGRHLLGTTLEGSTLVSLGRFARELYGAVHWHADGGPVRLTPVGAIRLRTERIRQFDAAGAEQVALGTEDARLTAGLELRIAPDWRIRLAADGFVWGGEGERGRSAVGGSIRVHRTGTTGPEVLGDAAATSQFQWAKLSLAWPVVRRRWSLRPMARIGWGEDLPLQWTHSLGGDEGVPGYHLGERRGSRELFGAVRFQIPIKGPIEIRATTAAGRAWIGNGDPADWVGGGRLGFGAETPAGAIDVAYGVSTTGRTAVYIRVGNWF
jgi:NTE family protein